MRKTHETLEAVYIVRFNIMNLCKHSGETMLFMRI